MTRYLRFSLALLVLAGSLAAQFSLRSSINGLVTDPSGAVMPGANVVLTDEQRNQTFKTTTNESGLYTFSNLTAGTYRVTVEHTGFRKAISDAVAIVSQSNIRIDLALQVGDVTESVSVSTEAATLLQTEQSVVGQTIGRELLDTLPALGRNFTSFQALAPNISSFPRGNQGTTWAVGSHHVVGGTTIQAGGGGDNGMYVNGVNVNDNYMGGTQYNPSLEAVAEVKVDVANFSAANGRDISTVSAATRSGANQFHGSLYDNFQNGKLNAWNTFRKSQATATQKKPFLQRNQFGGSIGGPVLIPKLYDGRDKAFFFVTYEGMKENNGAGDAFYRVPTAAERTGDFSELLRRFQGDPNRILYNPFSTVIGPNGSSTRTPVTNNDLRTLGRVNQNALELMALYPLPNGYRNPSNANDLNNYQTFASRTNFNYRFDTRFDYRFTQNDTVYVAFSKSHGKDSNGGGLFPQLPENVEDQSNLVTVNYAKVFSPAMTNEFIFGFSRAQTWNIDSNTLETLRQPDSLRNKFFKNLGTPENFGYHRIAFSDGGWYRVGYNEVLSFNNPAVQFSDNLSLLKSRHSMKFGFSYISKVNDALNWQRQVTFSKSMTSAGSVGNYLGGDAVASMLLGIPASLQQQFAFQSGELPNSQNTTDVWGFYGEDKWQITPKLTLNAGLRYDLSVPVYSSNNFNNARMDFSYPGWQLKIPGRAEGLAQRDLLMDKNNFAPRMSLAYRMKNDLVIRASYGIFFQAGISEFRVNSTGNVAGSGGETFNNARYAIHDDLPHLTFNDIFPVQTSVKLGTYPVSTGVGQGYFAAITSITALDDKSTVVPYFQRYLFDVQKGLGSSTALTFSFVGGRGTKLPIRENLNRGPYRTGWASTNAYDAARFNNNGRFSNVRVLRPGSNSFYNAATVKLERRLSKGLQILAHYTFSKTVTDPVLYQPENLGLGNDPQWDWNRALGRGEASFSHPHRVISAITYALPSGAQMPVLAKTVLGGWSVSMLATFESGNALTPGNGQTSARDQEPNRPNISGDPNLERGERTPFRYFNTSVISAPPQDVKGNAGQGIIRGPGQNNIDFTMSKAFRPVERMKIDFRAEFYNFFNHTQWSSINVNYVTNVGNTFGWVTGSRDARVVQLNLRVSF